ncbi:SDR family NAD(P)-dependent oxidoreductase [Anthocerotibacter panamensis]|uniref:SDR family NAD(P)-dependent oxidoreductase n=1 Tax=Anthocerotibacter panamensis TaxID=2857077 RepID=UPI001C4031AA|nr:SDR family NAD(P)-dependent oxidoreductase [Anthocerotibacter panamensis]
MRLDDALLTEIRQILAEETGQALETITAAQVQEYVDLFLEEAPPSVLGLFEAQVERTPEQVALVSEEETWTYAQLNARANQIAHALIAQAIPTGAVVGLCYESTPQGLAALLGTLKAGGALLLVDPADPETDVLLTRAQAVLLLTERPRPSAPVAQRLLDSFTLDAAATTNPELLPGPTAWAQVLPAGPPLTHGVLTESLGGLQAALVLCSQDVVLPRSSGALYEILWPLTVAARLVLARPSGPEPLAQLIIRHAISVLHLIPSDLSRLIGPLAEIKPDSLKWVLCSGEPLAQGLVDRFFEQVGGALYFLWGPGASAVTLYTCQPQEARAWVPAGKPLASAVYILDSYQQMVPEGVTGTIYLEGTADSLPSIEHAAVSTQEQGRLLRGGILELAPALDRTCWIRGLRIHLEAVETLLSQEVGVIDCAVLARTTDDFRQELVAYVVSEGTTLQANKRLPAVLVPDRLVTLASLPLLSSGQVDELALSQLPVLDATLIERWEERLRALSEVQEVAVLLQPHPALSPPLHLADLLLPAPTVTVPRPPAPAPSTQPALSSGGVLAPDSPQTLPGLLYEAARTAPDHGITYLQADGSEQTQTYPQLLEAAQRILQGLQNLALQPQNPVLLQLTAHCDLISAFWGCLLGGFIPLILPLPPTFEQPNSALDKLVHTWRFLDEPVILTAASQCKALAEALPGSRLSAIEDLHRSEPSLQIHQPQPEAVAFFSLSSGSTGVPKCIMLTHQNLISRTRGTNLLCGHSPEDIILNWLPFDHIGSISDWHLRCVALGCRMVYVPKERVLGEPLYWLELLDRYRISHSWAPNFAYALINQALKQPGTHAWDLTCVTALLSSGEAVSPTVVTEFLANLAPWGLKPTVIQPAFGMAELGSGITYFQATPEQPVLCHTLDKASLGGSLSRLAAGEPNAITFVDLGTPIPGVTIRIVDPDNQPLTEDTVGRLQVRGEAVFVGYYRNPEATGAALLADGWFDTGDLGFLAQGHLVVVGRQKESIILNGANYYSHDIEQVVEAVAGVEVSFTAACAVRDAGQVSDRLAIFLVPKAQADLAQLLLAVRQQVAERVGISVDYLLPVAKIDIPKTAIGKIQRAQLKQRFEAGEFAQGLKRVDLLLGNERTVGDWFYQKVWRVRSAARLSLSKQPTLVFVDALGLGDIVCEQLPEWVRVEAAEAFERRDAHHYRIHPADPEHYHRLLSALKADGLTIQQVLHLWTYQEPQPPTSAQALEAVQDRGVYSLLALVQALAQAGEAVSIRVASCQIQGILPGEAVGWEHSALLGLLKTVHQELPQLSCHHVDLPVDTPAANAVRILSELDTSEREIAYRSGQRWVPRLQKVDMVHAVRQPVPFQTGGVYLLSGGLGGVGLEVAKYLLQTYQARLLILGRSAQPGERLKTLQGLGGEVRYEKADLCDLQAVQGAVARARAQWGECHGVLHLAGVYQENMLLTETRAGLQAVLQPKLVGSWVLHQVFKDQPDALFISFSSVSGFFGAATLTAYAAANGAQEAFTAYRQALGYHQSYCLSWTIWDELGMSQGNPHKELVQARGFQVLPPRQAVHSLLAALRTGQTSLWIGLDDSKPGIRRYLESRDHALHKLVAYFTARTPLTVAALQTLSVSDLFGQPSSCAGVQLAQMPKTEAGVIDREQLQRLGQSHRVITPERVAPRTDLERQLARLWQDVLGVAQVSVWDNFFTLGGSSLMLTQLVSRIRDAFQVDLPLQVLFNSPTLAGMAKLLLARQLERQDQSKVTQMLKDLKNLSPEQIKALLKAKAQR